MTTEERIKLAKAKVETIISLLRTLIQIRANNEFLLHLAKQVGKSYAANAFNVLRDSLYEMELVRLCALWDAAQNAQQARTKNSLPAISWLVSTDETIAALSSSIKEDRLKREIRNLGPERGAYIEEFLAQMQARRAQEEAARVAERLRAARAKIAEVAASNLHLGLKNFRDKHIAHSLVQTWLETKGKVVDPEYGHEKELLDATLSLVSDLNYGICDASFSWETAWANSRYCSEALLSKTALNVLR